MVHWGSQTTLPPTPYNYVAIAAGVNHCLGLRSDGTVVSWGGSYPVPAGLSNVVDIAAGYDHSLALRSDGTVVTWGATNTYGRNLIPPGLTNVIGIACGCTTAWRCWATARRSSSARRWTTPPTPVLRLVSRSRPLAPNRSVTGSPESFWSS